MNISIILPAYNEKDTVEPLIRRILNLKYPVEIIVVDDNSPDGTWKIVDKISKENNNVRLLRRIDKKGLTSAILDGISNSKGEIVVWMDCDLT